MNVPLTLPYKQFPLYTFLMVDDTLDIRQRAADIADAMRLKSPHTFVDDFSLPLQDALKAMFDMGWELDLGNPAIANQLRLPNAQTADIMLQNLYEWHIRWFPPPQLGRQALMRANEAVLDAHNFVYRDATPSQIRPFLEGAVPHRDIVIVKLTNDAWPARYMRLPERELLASQWTTDHIIEKVLEIA